MGGSKTTVAGSTTNVTQPVPTAEETALNKLGLERQQAAQQGLIGVQTAGLDLTNQLLRGQEPLPGFFNELSQGISQQITGEIVQNSLSDLNTQLSASGVGTFRESGAAQAAGVRAASDIRRQTQEFNLGSKVNLLNLALSGQGQVQQPIQGFSGELGQRLAGLRTINQTGTSSQVTSTPFDWAKAAGTAIGAKASLACIEEGTMIDTPLGQVSVENLRAKDEVFDKNGDVCTIKMKYEFDEEPNDNRFYKVSFDNGAKIVLCDMHKIDGVRSMNMTIGQMVNDMKVSDIRLVNMTGRSYDLLTSSIDGGYRSNGIPIDTMIPELQAAMGSR